MKYLFLLLFSLNCYASELSLGIVGGNSKGIAGGDYKILHVNEKTLGVGHYGSTFFRYQLGNGFGLSLGSFSGFNYYETSIFTFGLEPFSGKLVGNTNSSIESYYNYIGSLTFGIKPFSNLLIISRVGQSISNHNYDGVSPHGNTSFGISSYYTLENIKFSFDYIQLGNGNYFNNYDVQIGKLGIRYERDKGQFEEQSLLMLWNIL